MSVLEYAILVELLILSAAGVMWAIARKPDEDQEGEPAYRIAGTFWRTLFERRSPFAAMPIDPDLPLPLRSRAQPESPSEAVTFRPVGQLLVTTLPVVVVPDSTCDQIVGFDPSAGDGQIPAIKMLVSAPAGSGQANKAVLQLLTEVLELQPYQVHLLRGHYNSRKILQITGIDLPSIQKKMSSYL